MLDTSTMTKEKNANHAATAPAYFSAWDIHAYYGESYIVQGVSMNIHEGEILALLGRNGAGKTSTLRAMARLDNPALKHGEIWLRPPDHSGPDGRGKPAAGADRKADRLVHRTYLRPVPASGRTPQARGHDPVGRRAADAGHRPCSGPRYQAAVAG
jgi:energy-coupling factor transporter ATP-binding protein EcfA2